MAMQQVTRGRRKRSINVAEVQADAAIISYRALVLGNVPLHGPRLDRMRQARSENGSRRRFFFLSDKGDKKGLRLKKGDLKWGKQGSKPTA